MSGLSLVLFRDSSSEGEWRACVHLLCHSLSFSLCIILMRRCWGNFLLGTSITKEKKKQGEKSPRGSIIEDTWSFVVSLSLSSRRKKKASLEKILDHLIQLESSVVCVVWRCRRRWRRKSKVDEELLDETLSSSLTFPGGWLISCANGLCLTIVWSSR